MLSLLDLIIVVNLNLAVFECHFYGLSEHVLKNESHSGLIRQHLLPARVQTFRHIDCDFVLVCLNFLVPDHVLHCLPNLKHCLLGMEQVVFQRLKVGEVGDEKFHELAAQVYPLEYLLLLIRARRKELIDQHDDCLLRPL